MYLTVRFGLLLDLAFLKASSHPSTKASFEKVILDLDAILVVFLAISLSVPRAGLCVISASSYEFTEFLLL